MFLEIIMDILKEKKITPKTFIDSMELRLFRMMIFDAYIVQSVQWVQSVYFVDVGMYQSFYLNGINFPSWIDNGPKLLLNVQKKLANVMMVRETVNAFSW